MNKLDWLTPQDLYYVLSHYSLRPLTHHFKNGQRRRQGHGHVDGRLQPFVALMKYLLVDDAQGRQNPNNPVELD